MHCDCEGEAIEPSRIKDKERHSLKCSQLNVKMFAFIARLAVGCGVERFKYLSIIYDHLIIDEINLH